MLLANQRRSRVITTNTTMSIHEFWAHQNHAAIAAGALHFHPKLEIEERR